MALERTALHGLSLEEFRLHASLSVIGCCTLSVGILIRFSTCGNRVESHLMSYPFGRRPRRHNTHSRLVFL